jgi:hypothetical protein
MSTERLPLLDVAAELYADVHLPEAPRAEHARKPPRVLADCKPGDVVDVAVPGDVRRVLVCWQDWGGGSTSCRFGAPLSEQLEEFGRAHETLPDDLGVTPVRLRL